MPYEEESTPRGILPGEDDDRESIARAVDATVEGESQWKISSDPGHFHPGSLCCCAQYAQGLSRADRTRKALGPIDRAGAQPWWLDRVG
jgi:hypothetical protein